MSWYQWVGTDGVIVGVGIDHFGASAPYQKLYEQFGLTPERVVAAAYSSLSKVGATSGSTTGT
jgi:Transketolase